MKLVIQRVDSAEVKVKDKIVGKIGKGFLVLLGVGPNDKEEIADYLVGKLCNLRVFEDENEKMNLGLKDVNGELLIVSQFTLYGDCRKGNRPSFVDAAPPEMANSLYEYFMNKCRQEGISVQAGKFGEHMMVSLLNNGPVTILMEK